MNKFLTFILFLFVYLYSGSFLLINAQSCGGSTTCCAAVTRTCNTCQSGPSVDPITGDCLCGSTSSCTGGTYSSSCYVCGSSGGPTCCVNTGQSTCYNPTFSCFYIPASNCPSGQIFCGGCINGCRPNTQTCNSWIAAECSGGGGGGGGGSCSWCTSSAECAAAGGTYEGDGSSWCTAPLGGCCVSSGPAPCSPSCGSPSCGQSNGCGGTCSNADDGAPATPTISTPTNGGVALMNPSTLRITIDWNDVTKADRYNVEVYPEGTNCSHPDARCVNTTSSVYTFVPAQVDYQVRVRAQNTDCGTDSSAWTNFIIFDVHAPVTGTLYLDPNNTAVLSGSACTTGASLSTIQAGASQVTISQNGQSYTAGNVAANGTYQASAPYWSPGNNILQLNIGDSSLYTCTCPAGCVYSGINTPTSTLNFYLIEARDPWFQLEGGPITALQTTGTAIRNYISDKCSADPTCSPYLIKKNNATDNTSGYVLTGGGSIDLSYAAGEQSSNADEDGRNIVATLDRRVAQERYEYFIRLYKFPETPTSDFTTTANDAQKPTLAPINSGVNAYYHNGDLRIEDQWDVSATDEIMVFVDGDVTIANQIQTEVGGFLGIIASGDIIIDPSVEHTDLTQTSGLVEGVFVANGQIHLPSRGASNGGDGRFVGEGSFVGWSGVVLERDYDNNGGRKVENNVKPTELFRYRPDFLLNAPDEITVPRYVWREVAP